MASAPADLKYSKSHEWVRAGDDGPATVGLTDYAQRQLGDVVYVELPEVGRNVEAGGPVGTVESVKAASDFYAPAGGEVTAVNEDLSGSPEQVNEDPYGDGWIFRLSVTDAGELGSLLDAAAYEAYVTSEGSGDLRPLGAGQERPRSRPAGARPRATAGGPPPGVTRPGPPERAMRPARFARSRSRS
ncbi:MAG TPA: glycine cleavage system protein GcvH [Trebonia sp.]|jgi:glycine cleavage system H protein|nr:glycine cleavage system protein GcvH [Trebonia sp.]